ncbi:MAG: DUF1284 domain-containing protein [Nitrospirota bacterium]
MNRPNGEIKFRGHHLICLHFFDGAGYSADFIAHLRGVMERTATDSIHICSGPDDVCIRCPNIKGGRCFYKENADEEIREMDRTALELLHLNDGASVKWQDIGEIIPGIFLKWSAKYCRGCGWLNACERTLLYQKICKKSGYSGQL